MIHSSSSRRRTEVNSNLILLLMVSSCFFIISSQRINMSIAIVEMIDWVALEGNDSITSNANDTFERTEKTFQWSYLKHNQILACYFYGSALAFCPAEYLAEKTIAKWVVVVGTSIASICTFLTPVLADSGGFYLMVLQLLKAVGHTAVMPAIEIIIMGRVPSRDQATFMGYALMSFPLGAFFTVLVSGIICTVPQLGWKFVFYFGGTAGAVWSVVWSYLVCDYFFPTALMYRSEPIRTETHLSIPLRDILKSGSAWSFLIAGMATYWAYSFNILILPMFMRRVYSLGIDWNALVSSVPNLLRAFLFLVTTQSCSCILKKDIKRKTNIRKFCIITGLLVFGSCTVLMTLTNGNLLVDIFLMMLAVGFIGLDQAAIAVLPVDMTPHFSHFLSGIMNIVGSIFGALLPLLISFLSKSEEEPKVWSKVLNMSTLVSFVAVIVFLAFGSADVQPWNSSRSEKRMDSIGVGTSYTRRHTITLMTDDTEKPSSVEDGNLENSSETDRRNIFKDVEK